ncbi:MAG TPA: hypothetical protein VHL77_01410, partial [Ferruginibacter sp.]|nr:hypothetical protein [Ferruginibacter sp.]
MKQFKKISLAYTLQIFSVIILFGYPGCSSNIKGEKMDSVKNDNATQKHASVKKPVDEKQIKHAGFSLQQAE